MKSSRKKILVVCSRNKRRSLTAEQLFRNDQHIEVRSAGTSPKARHHVSTKDMAWADEIIVMERKHQQLLYRLFPGQTSPSIHVADIPDEFEYMDAELSQMLRDEVRKVVEGV